MGHSVSRHPQALYECAARVCAHICLRHLDVCVYADVQSSVRVHWFLHLISNEQLLIASHHVLKPAHRG